mgnify:CR=1 FL=1
MAAENAHGIIDRMIGAARLNVDTFEEVEADTSTTKQALLVVALVALATGIGSGGIVGLVIGTILAVAGWALWAWIVYLVGTKVLPEPDTDADWGQLARTLGFAQSPGILKVFGAVPVIGDGVLLIVSAWMLIAMVIAVRQALDYTSTLRALGVVLLGFIPYALFWFVMFAMVVQ